MKTTMKASQIQIPLMPFIAAAALATLLPRADAQNYILHEWGTFTTVIGSDGTHLDGVHREDAPLPDFVYALDKPPKLAPKVRRMTKGLDYSRTFAHVNVRLETPVIYFYTGETFAAQVDVGFKGGSIGQWYPQRSAGEKRHPRRLLDFAKHRDGSVRWNVQVEPAGQNAAARVFRSGELPCWLYPRYPDSALVTNEEGETEKYLFYRGLGRMKLPVVLTASDRELHATNIGKDEVARWLVFQLNHAQQARWWSPDALRPATGSKKDSVTLDLDAQPFRSDWKRELYAEGQKMLMDAGLYRAEADAMLQTWWSGYFETPGLRVFWVVPRSQVDAILPLQVSPAPSELERVIVGRSEILTPSFEKRLIADFAAASGRERGNRWASDRFFPAYAARVKQLTGMAGAGGAEVAGSPSPAPKPTWNDRISSAKLGPGIRVVAFEHANFKGARTVLDGAAAAEGASGDYPLFVDANDGLQPPANWNDRISSLVVIDGRDDDLGKKKEDGSAANRQAIFYENARYDGAALKLEVGAKIPDLVQLKK